MMHAFEFLSFSPLAFSHTSRLPSLFLCLSSLFFLHDPRALSLSLCPSLCLPLCPRPPFPYHPPSLSLSPSLLHHISLSLSLAPVLPSLRFPSRCSPISSHLPRSPLTCGRLCSMPAIAAVFFARASRRPPYRAPLHRPDGSFCAVVSRTASSADAANSRCTKRGAALLAMVSRETVEHRGTRLSSLKKKPKCRKEAPERETRTVLHGREACL